MNSFARMTSDDRAVLSGRYKIVKFLGEGAFSKAISCVVTPIETAGWCHQHVPIAIPMAAR